MLDQTTSYKPKSIHLKFYGSIKFTTAPQRFLVLRPEIVLTSPQQRRRARAQPQSLITGHRCSATGSRRKSGEITSPKQSGRERLKLPNRGRKVNPAKTLPKKRKTQLFFKSCSRPPKGDRELSRVSRNGPTLCGNHTRFSLASR